MTDQNTQKEKQILIRAIHSAYFTRKVLARNVSVLIKKPVYQEIANVVVRHYGVSDELLTQNTLNMMLEQRLKRKAEQKHIQLNENQLDAIYQLNANLVNAHEDNSESILIELQRYIHTQLASNAILEEAAKGNDDISDRVSKRLDKINEIELTGTKYQPLDIFGDMERRLDIYQHFGSQRVPSGLKPLDILTGGGLEIGQIGLIAGGQSSGKTAFLTNLSYYYAMRGRQNVLHISLEELDTDQLLRFDRILTNTSVKEAFDQNGSIRSEYIQHLKNYYHKMEIDGNSHGKIFFEKSTPMTLTVDDIRQMANAVERENQCKIQVIVLDYADLLKRRQYSDNEAQAGELLFQDLVKLAQETHTLIFTGSQLNRGMGIVDVKTMDNIEGSYRKKNTIAFGATINSSPEERQKGYVRLYLDKVRNNYGFDDQFLYLRYDRKSMRLHAESPEEQEEHKALVDASQSNTSRNQQPIKKGEDLSSVINNALGGQQ